MPNQFTGREITWPIGFRHGKLEVIGDVFLKTYTQKNGRVRSERYVPLRCDCGVEVAPTVNNFKSGRIETCSQKCSTKILRPADELAGWWFGDLQVIEIDQRIINGPNSWTWTWKARCRLCGEVGSYRGSTLKRGDATKCFACSRSAPRKPTHHNGARYGSLVVIRPWGISLKASGDKVRNYLCQCDCGGQSIVRGGNLASGNTTRCLRCSDKRETITKHCANPDFAQSLCQFYIFTHADDDLLKLGISVNPWKRANQYKDYEHRYQCPIFMSQKLPRSWIFTAEQILLHETLPFKAAAPEDWGDKWCGQSELRSWRLDVDAVVMRFYEILEEIESRDGDFYGVYQTYMRVAPDASKYTQPEIELDFSGSAGLLGFCYQHSSAPAIQERLKQMMLEPSLV